MKGPSLAGLDAEIRDHIERETEDNIARGMSPDAARHAAFKAFGNRTTTREDGEGGLDSGVARTAGTGSPLRGTQPAAESACSR